MKNLCAIILVLLLCNMTATGQYYPITVPSTFPSTQTIGSNTVTVINNSASGGGHCNISGFWAGSNDNTGFTYNFANPISDIKIRLVGLDSIDVCEIVIDNNVYYLQPNELTQYNVSCSPGMPFANDISNGRLVSHDGVTTAPNGKAAQIDIHPPTSASSVKITGYMSDPTGTPSGFIYNIDVVNDTCYNYSVTALAQKNTCAGDTMFLSASELPGATYHWYGPNGFQSTAKDTFIANVSKLDSGMYLVLAQRGGCLHVDDTLLNVFVPPIPDNTTSDAPVCAGATLHLSTDNITGITDFVWNGPAGFTANVKNPTIGSVSPLGEGWYYVRTKQYGCLSKPDSTWVDLLFPVAPPSITLNTPVCPGTDLHLGASTVTNGTYYWWGPGGYNANTQNATRTNVSYDDSGYYYVSVMVNGCMSEADSEKVEVMILTPTPVAGANTPVCPGTSLNLTASYIAGAIYTWSGPSFSGNTKDPVRSNVKFADSGDYIVTATVNGCTSLPDTVNVEVKMLTPTPEADSFIVACPGADLKLHASDIAGADYIWMGPNYTGNTQSPVIPGATYDMAGTYYVRANINGCISYPDSTVVEVRITTPTPDAAVNSPVCTHDDIKLTAGDITGADFKWTGPNDMNDNNQNPVITDAGKDNAGAYIVTANIDGCISLPDTVWVDVKDRPEVTAGSNSPVCERKELTLYAESIPYNEQTIYSWTGPGGFTAASDTVIITPTEVAQTGKYTITTMIDGCTSEPVEIYVEVNTTLPDPVATGGKVYNGNRIQLKGEGLVPNMAFKWTGPNGYTSNEQNPIIDPVTEYADGIYTLETSLGGCASYDTAMLRVLTDYSFQLFPNPNNGKFIFKGDVKTDQVLKIDIVNSAGQVVYRFEVASQFKHVYKQMDLEGGLPPGEYFLRLEIDGKTKHLRFVVAY